MKFSQLTVEDEGVFQVAAEGKITGETIQASGQNPFEAALGPIWARQRVLFDMARISFLDSAAIGWLIKSHKEFKKHGGLMVLHSLSPHVEQVFKLLSLDKIVTLADGEIDARALLSAAQA
jgi:anti-anti-sigma factor